MCSPGDIFNVLKKLKRELEISYILITHDIATSSELADKVAVMLRRADCGSERRHPVLY